MSNREPIEWNSVDVLALEVLRLGTANRELLSALKVASKEMRYLMSLDENGVSKCPNDVYESEELKTVEAAIRKAEGGES